jgi:hypothetical protein
MATITPNVSPSMALQPAGYPTTQIAGSGVLGNKATAVTNAVSDATSPEAVIAKAALKSGPNHLGDRTL